MITLNQLARRLGLSNATVSRALRNHSNVAESTRQRVRDAAAKHGYEPSAAMSTAMSAARSSGNRQYQETIGVISGQQSLQEVENPNATPLPDQPRRIAIKEGIEGRCREIGYRTDHFVLPEERTAPLRRVLETRGIRRIIVVPAVGWTGIATYRAVQQLSDQFQTVLLGSLEWASQLQIPTCQPDLYAAGRQAFLRIWQAGYQHIIVSPQIVQLNQDGRFLAGIQEALRVTQASVTIALPPIATHPKAFSELYEPAGPETCIIGSSTAERIPAIRTLLARRDAPGWLDWHANLRHLSDLAGIDQRDAEQGRQCVDLCAGQSDATQVAINSSKHLMVQPGWIDGSSIQALSQAHDALGACDPFHKDAREVYRPLFFRKRQLCDPAVIRQRVYPNPFPFPRRGISHFHGVEMESRLGSPMVLSIRKTHPQFQCRAVIPFGQQAEALYFLHTLFRCRQAARVGRYEVLYADGKVEEIPIHSADLDLPAKSETPSDPLPNIRDWWPSVVTPLRNAVTRPIRLIDLESPLNQLGFLWLYRWENLRPEERIEAIRVVAEGSSQHLLMLFAVTAALVTE